MPVGGPVGSDGVGVQPDLVGPVTLVVHLAPASPVASPAPGSGAGSTRRETAMPGKHDKRPTRWPHPTTGTSCVPGAREQERKADQRQTLIPVDPPGLGAGLGGHATH